MTKHLCSLLLTGAALAAFSLPLAAQDASNSSNSEVSAYIADDSTRAFSQRLCYGDDCTTRAPRIEVEASQIEGELTPIAGDGFEAATAVLETDLESESPEARGTSAVFTLPGEFLVGSRNNMNWQYDMFFGEERSFKKIVVDVDFYHGGWAGRVNNDPINYGGDYYCVFWLNAGSQWTNAIAYLNFIFPRGQLENQSNIGGYWYPPGGSYGLRLKTGCSVGQGGNYKVHYEYNAEAGNQSFTLTENGQQICGTSGFAGESPRISSSYMFIQFGSQYSPEGPEGATFGWRFSNFKIQFIGDNPIGRRPRRR